MGVGHNMKEWFCYFVVKTMGVGHNMKEWFCYFVVKTMDVDCRLADVWLRPTSRLTMVLVQQAGRHPGPETATTASGAPRAA